MRSHVWRILRCNRRNWKLLPRVASETKTLLSVLSFEQEIKPEAANICPHKEIHEKQASVFKEFNNKFHMKFLPYQEFYLSN